MSESTLKEKTAKGLFWGGISNGSIQITSMLFGLFLARMLDIEDYGLVAMLQIFIAIANTIIESGFAVALTNKIDAKHRDFNAVFWFTVFIGIAVYIILFFASPLIARFYEKPELVPIARVLFVSFMFGGAASTSNTVLFKQLMVKERARVDIITVIISGTAGVFLAYKGYGYWALVIQSVLYVSINSCIKFIIAPWKPTLQIDFSPLKEIFSFSIKLFFTNIVVQVNKNVFSMISGKIFGEWQLGLYAQGEKWMSMGSGILTGMVNSVAHPVLVQVRDDRERFLNVFRKMIRFAAFVSFPLMLGVAFIAGEFIPLALGEKWLPSVPFLQMLCLVGAVWPIWHLYTYVIISHGRSGIFLKGSIIQGVLQISSLLLVSGWGIYWMVIAYIITFYISLFYWHYYAYRLIGIRITQILADVMPYLGIVGVVFSLVWLVTLPLSNALLLLVSKIILSIIIYMVILWFGKSVIFRESIEMLLKKKM